MWNDCTAVELKMKTWALMVTYYPKNDPVTASVFESLFLTEEEMSFGRKLKTF